MLAVAAVLVLRAVVVETVRIGSESMAPALRQGDSAVLDKVSFRFRGPRRGDVIAFDSPQDGALVVKRVVALAGDTVEIRDAVLVVDGTPADEPQIDTAAYDGTWFGPVTVPTGTVFVLGDNRARSIDSRVYGAVPIGAVRGRALF
jgi:signal peptidase I